MKVQAHPPSIAFSQTGAAVTMSRAQWSVTGLPKATRLAPSSYKFINGVYNSYTHRIHATGIFTYIS